MNIYSLFPVMNKRKKTAKNKTGRKNLPKKFVFLNGEQSHA